MPNSPTHTLLLFDIDGTLMRSGGAGMRAMAHVGKQLFGDGFTWEGIDSGGHMDPLIFSEAAAINGLSDDPTHHQRFHDAYIGRLEEEFEASRHAIEVMPGILSVLEHLRRRADEKSDVVLGLLTGNYTRAVPIKLRAIGVEPEWFTVTAFGDEGPTRASLVGVAVRKYVEKFGQTIDPRKIIIIGDTPRDVACAKANGARCLAVATGGYKIEVLQAAEADVAVRDLLDPGPLMEMIDGKQQQHAGS